MYRIKRVLCQLVIFAFMLSSMPAQAHLCAHDMRGDAAVTVAKAEAPPCHPPEPATQKTSDKPDCCGDMCQCAIGTCNALPFFIGVKMNDMISPLSATAYFNAATLLSSFMPEQATPPPR